MEGFESNVFINCPFDKEYYSLLRPLLFTIVFLGFNPRIANERSDPGENRVDKIRDLIRDSRYSVHDLSRLRSKQAEEFYRLNMPFELGIEYGARVFGPAFMADKRCLILEQIPMTFGRRSLIFPAWTSSLTATSQTRSCGLSGTGSSKPSV